MRLIIKNMVSLRCKMIVKSELENLGLSFTHIELGEVQLTHEPSALKYQKLKTALLAYGLELIENKKSVLIEKIKNVIVEMVHYSDELPVTNFSDYLSKKLDYDYHYLSNLFSEVKGITIERYIIAHKIERVKELLVYDELPLKQIADKLHYSSVAHLCNQFKKVTGLTPTFFKTMKGKRFKAREEL